MPAAEGRDTRRRRGGADDGALPLLDAGQAWFALTLTGGLKPGEEIPADKVKEVVRLHGREIFSTMGIKGGTGFAVSCKPRDLPDLLRAFQVSAAGSTVAGWGDGEVFVDPRATPRGDAEPTAKGLLDADVRILPVFTERDGRRFRNRLRIGVWTETGRCRTCAVSFVAATSLSCSTMRTGSDSLALAPATARSSSIRPCALLFTTFARMINCRW